MAQAAEVRFRYLGPSRESKPLASGELRRQIGLKLRAQDTCNLLYVMWHIEPDSRIAVSIKRNPGKHTHQQCDAHGYINVQAKKSTEPMPVMAGGARVLRAEMNGPELTVSADGKVVWDGLVGGLDFDGPVGFRTDNGRFAFDYLVGRPTREARQASENEALSCRHSPED